MSPPFISPHLSPLAFIPRVLLDQPTGSLGGQAPQPVLTLQKLYMVPIISSCNLKMNGEVPFSVSISNQFSGKWRFWGWFCFMFHSYIKFGVQERSEQTLDFSENQIT